MPYYHIVPVRGLERPARLRPFRRIVWVRLNIGVRERVFNMFNRRQSYARIGVPFPT